MEEGSEEVGAGLGKRLLAIVAAALAARAAAYAVEFIWTKGFGQDLPGENDDDSLIKAALWVGFMAAAVAISREIAQGLAERTTRV